MRLSRAAFGSLTRGTTIVALLAFACAAATLQAQEVYKSVDTNGHVVYSDRGSTKGAPKTAVHFDQPDPTEVARLAHEQELLKADDLARSHQEAVEDKSRAAQQKKKQAACESARNRFYQMKDAARLYKRDTDGSRVYYSDDDAETMRQQARQAMSAACGT
jgi:hypothetical protein